MNKAVAHVASAFVADKAVVEAASTADEAVAEVVSAAGRGHGRGNILQLDDATA